MSDEGLHEIQLNGKQLVFLFMAATVVAVVIFLCGVMVGRGVPTRPGSLSDVPTQTSLDPTAAAQRAGLPSVIASTGSTLVTAGETLSYPELLAASDLPEETFPAQTLRPAAETAVATALPPAPVRTPEPPRVVAKAVVPPPPVKPVPPRAVAKPIAPAPVKPELPRAVAKPVAPIPPKPEPPRAVATSAPTVATSLNEPTGGGFVVQVAAVRTRADAEVIARRLTTKGYPAFITTAGANFRVRVGTFNDRSEAATVAGRLQREERFTPWITR